jgi:hypothetical protein
VFEPPQNTTRRRRRRGKMTETKRALPHLVNSTRYPARISHMVKRKAMGQWKSWLSAVIIGMNETPQAMP